MRRGVQPNRPEMHGLLVGRAPLTKIAEIRAREAEFSVGLVACARGTRIGSAGGGRRAAIGGVRRYFTIETITSATITEGTISSQSLR
jgi:hypothetical protein